MDDDVSDLPDIDKSIEKRKTAKTSSASSASIASFGSSIGRRFSFKSFSSRKPTTKVEKPRNEFGLNTVYEPDETSAVIADLVFVHGLGGGSSTTWCLKQDADYFWPKEWLPKDPDFKGVRIHSFGYNANWATWLKSPVDIHAFGQSLVEDLRSDPKINNLDSRIVLVGHSMGGLVIKKACVLSKTNPDYSDIANRLHSLYFLGTPHRGSNLAGVLNNFLRLSGSGRRAYVSSLQAKSESIRILSDSFRIHYAGIHLHTFYESQPTPPVGMIVDQESATLGYAEERIQLLNANHRDLAKFETTLDSNYRSLRNRLASTIDQIRLEMQKQTTPSNFSSMEIGIKTPDAPVLLSLPELYQSRANEMEEIAKYLSIDASDDKRLSTLNNTRMTGSGSWLTNRTSFREWRSPPAPRYFWLKGTPASGKSMLASYVIEFLQDSPVCHYFFNKGDKTDNNVSSFLRSMALQMAQINPVVRSAIFRLSQKGPPIDARNQRTIWKTVFTSCVFHVTFPTPHYWVVDALDEAADRGTLNECFSLLSKIDENIPLKIFVTSRPDPALDDLFVQLPLVQEYISPEDLLPDISSYVQKWSATFPVNTTQERERLVDKIVRMSGGSFLWTVLVTKQLREVFTVGEVHEVLCEIPQEMDDLYTHNIRKMESLRSKSAAKHTITWAICAVHPLTVNQMKDAIRLTLGSPIARDLRTSLQYLCGYFLDIDVQSRSNELFNTLDKFFRTNVLSWIEHVAHLKDLDCLNRTSRHLSNYLNRRMEHVPLLQSDLHAWAVDLPRLVTQFGVNLLSDPAAIHTLVPPFCPRDSAVYRHFGYAEDGIKLVGAWNAGWGDRICSISYHDTYATVAASRDERFAVGLADGLVNVYRTSTCEHLLSMRHEESVSVLEFGSTSKVIASAGLRFLRLWDAATGVQLFHIATDSQTLALTFDETETSVTIATRDKHVLTYRISDGSPLHQVPWIDAFSEDTDSGFAPSPSAARLSTEQQTLAIVYRSKPVQLWSLDKQHRIGACLRPATHKNDKGGHTVNCLVFNTSSANPRLLVSYWDDILVKFDSRTCKPLLTTATCVTKIAMSCNEKTFAGSDGNGGIKIFDFETLQPLHNIHIQGDPVSSLAFTSDSLRIVDSRGTQANVWEPLVLFGQDTEALSSEPSESVHQIVDDIVESVVNESAIITTLHCCDQSGMAFCGRNDGRVDTCNLDDPENTMRKLYKHGGSFISITCMDWSPRARVIASADSAGKFCIMKITTGTRREWSAEMMVQSRLGQGCIIRQILVHPEGSFVLVSSSESDSIWSLSTKKQVASLDRRERIAWKWFVRPSAPSQLLLFEDKILRLFRWEDLHQIAASENPVVPIEIERRMSGEQADADAISVSSEGDDLVILQRSQTVQHSVPGLRPQSNDAMMTKIRVFDLTTLDPESTDIGGSSSPDMSIDNATQSLIFLNPKPSSTLGIPLSPTATPNVPFSYPFGGGRSKSYTRWSSIRDVADIPDVERIIGTVKKFDWWHLIFLSKMGWVCSVQIGEGGRKVLDQFQKHFFVPSVWRTGNSPLIAKVRRSHDIVIVHQDGVIVVKNGLDNGEHVSFSLSTL
ncbi:uncharacterized protein J4E88_002726 [Alternaria novae-zelandiae]|uniref:uncharacterized protein n=1 Tax=Alternaria novae-zelandiae TaxID=430562 RepID=UPI0020C21997|nr:uncharacterized protein J4E88_002726 [Alternaria novae-zelandiae]KAI4689374.1 hypothetical protein J4E88_002726 [Alternaria novae-zelandiae]